jgi:hypothetical protein
MAKTTSPRPRDRSPNYPAVGFRTALELATKIWAAEKRHPMNPVLAVKRMGYTGLNGKSIVVLSALRKYGLVEGADKGEVKIAEDAVPLMVLPPGAPERADLIRSFALRPPLFKEILADSGEALPSDENLRARLQTKYKFTEVAAENVVRALRETLSELQELPPSSPSSSPAPTETAEPQRSLNEIFSDLFRKQAARSTPEQTIRSTPDLHVWSLGGDVKAELRIIGKAGPKHMEMLKRYVELLAMSGADAGSTDDKEGDPLG